MIQRRYNLIFLALLPLLVTLQAPAAKAATVSGSVRVDPSSRAGTDAAGRVLLFAPSPLQRGSSISHWDTTATPNLLMEPNNSINLPFGQVDLARQLMFDVGWPSGNSNVVLRVRDAPGEGFNDPTLGASRIAAAQFAADVWGNILGSSVTINISVGFEDLECSTSGGVLAQAAPQFIFESFSGAPIGGTWYPGALAESLSGQNLSLQDDPDPTAGEVIATFNSAIDRACLGNGTRYHYGLTSGPPGTINFVNVMLHEVAHGLGFATISNTATGALFLGLPDIYLRNIFDNSTGRLWHQMTSGERVASATRSGRIAWNGTRVTNQAPNVLQQAPALFVAEPASIAGRYLIGTAAFGPPVTAAGVFGEFALVQDGSANPSLGCNPLVNGNEINGRIALVDRGTCDFTIKARNAQQAGARAVVIINNVGGNPPGLGGTDASIVIPTVSVRRDDGQLFKNALAAPDDEPGTLSFSSSTYQVGEGAGNATITVTRSGGGLGQVSVDFATQGGSATVGQDYLNTTGTLTFADGEQGNRTFQVPILDDANGEDNETVNLALSNPTNGAILGSPATAQLTITDNEPCIESVTTACLSSGRFKVQVTWTDFDDNSDSGERVPAISDDSALYYFFDPDNWELLVKVLNGCAFNNRYWVFSAATTNLAYSLTVTDTQTGDSQTYENILGESAPAVTDTNAFSTCP